MTKLLDDAIAAIRERSDTEQDEAAALLHQFLDPQGEIVEIDDETRAILLASLREADAGLFVDDDVIAEADRRHRR